MNAVADRLGLAASIDDTNTMVWTTRLLFIGAAVAAGFAVLGLPPVSLPMPTFAIGLVTPTCGLTRASTALARGDLATAWAFNPASFLVASWSLFALGRWVVGSARGRWLNLRFRPTRAAWTYLAAAFVILGVNQQMHAELIMHGTV